MFKELIGPDFKVADKLSALLSLHFCLKTFSLVTLVGPSKARGPCRTAPLVVVPYLYVCHCLRALLGLRPLTPLSDFYLKGRVLWTLEISLKCAVAKLKCVELQHGWVKMWQRRRYSLCSLWSGLLTPSCKAKNRIKLNNISVVRSCWSAFVACVLNLTTDDAAAFSQAFCLMYPGNGSITSLTDLA